MINKEIIKIATKKLSRSEALVLIGGIVLFGGLLSRFLHLPKYSFGVGLLLLGIFLHIVHKKYGDQNEK